ncbi:MAG: carboxypeptidase M32 [Phycisphaeraceae bacterium]|nr:carboxypeptidase M32 [Phycisphaeraceae bacterium]
MTRTYRALSAYARTTATIESVARLAGWDQETYMPPGGAESRAEQLAALASIAHERKTSSQMRELIEACEQDRELTSDAESAYARSVHEFRHDFDRATKLPGDLVEELARAASRGQQVWKQARKANDFAAFRPALEAMIELTRRKAECYGVPRGGEPYDALLEDYEPGATAREIEAAFSPLRDRLSAMLAELGKGEHPDESITRVKIDPARQHELGLFVLKAMGFDLDAGRLDTTTHPFCDGLGPGDTRLTTRYREDHFTGALYGTLHEMGHGLYEQGLPKADHFGTPLGDAIGLGMHESQSRMWENMVGRSLAFWEWLLPYARKIVGGALDSATPRSLYAATNTAKASLIRVEADEATYNLHIMLRFGIERAVFRGDLAARDIPGVWDETFKQTLGLDVPDDARGCMQDVHWSAGLLGYFPTYALGNLYAAQFFEAARRDLGDLDAQFGRGDFAPLLGWLKTNIHAHGRRFRAGELCQRVTGRALSHAPLMRYLEGKLRPIYGV